jgi:hypothetical protein
MAARITRHHKPPYDHPVTRRKQTDPAQAPPHNGPQKKPQSNDHGFYGFLLP